MTIPAERPAALQRPPAAPNPALDGHLLRIIGVTVYTTDADGRITFFTAADFRGRRPGLGEEWCGSLRRCSTMPGS